MSKIVKKFFFLILIIMPFFVFADTYDNAKEKANKLLNERNFINTYERYIVSNNNIKFEYDKGTIKSNSEFTKGGFISISEYELSKKNNSSYLFDGIEYWSLTKNNGKIFTINSSSQGQAQTASSNFNTRVTEYVKSNIRVTGKGTLGSPWFFDPLYKVSVNVDNNYATLTGDNFQYVRGMCNDDDCKAKFKIASKALKYKYITNDCGATYDGEYLIVSNVNRNITCNVVFGKGIFKVTLEGATPSEIYLKYGDGFYKDAEAQTPIVKITGVPTSETQTFKEYRYNSYLVIDENKMVRSDAIKAITSNVVLPATWQSKRYTIVFDSNDSINNTKEQVCIYNENCSLYNNTFTRTGYAFAGWSKSRTGNVEFTDGQSVRNLTLDDSITLYAVWRANSYSLAYDLDKGTFGSSHPTTANYDQALTINNPTKSISLTLDLNATGATIDYTNSSFTTTSLTKNYTFNGWNITGMDNTLHHIGSENTTSTSTTASLISGTYFKNLRSSAGTVTFTALWSVPEIKMPALIKNDYNCVWKSDEYSWESNATYVPANPGGATERTFKAHCEQVSYDGRIFKITLNNQSATSSGTTAVYLKYNFGWYSDAQATNQITRITVPSKTGYTFKGYYTELNANGTLIINSNGTFNVDNREFRADRVIYAAWEKNSYTLAYDVDGGTHGSSHPTTAEYDEEVTVSNPSKSITVNLNQGNLRVNINYSGSSFTNNSLTKNYTFNGWNISGMDSATHYLGSNANTSTSSSATGITGTYFKNLRSTSGVVTFTAKYTSPEFILPSVTKAGYTCKWVSDQYSYSSLDTYKPASSNGATERTFTATCTANAYVITLDKQGGTGGTSTIYLKYNTGWYSDSSCSNEISSITVPSKEGYRFAGYFKDQTYDDEKLVIDPNGNFIFTTSQITSNTTLYAYFVLNSYSISYDLDKGSYGASHPTNVNYNTEFAVNNPSKAIKVTLDLADSGATISYSGSDFTATTLTKNYTFNGWNISGMDSITHTIGNTTTNETSVNNITATTFKNLRGTSGEVLFEAKWNSPSFILPRLTKTEYTCNWTSDEYTYSSQGTYTPATTGGATSRTMTASCSPIIYDGNIYTISLNKQGGAEGTTTIYEKYNYGWYSNSTATTSITSITKPAKEGYSFRGYYTETNGSGTKVIDASGNILSGTNILFKSNTTIYAYWTANTYSVSYDADGGTVIGSPSERVSFDSEFTVSNPTKLITATLKVNDSEIKINYDRSDFNERNMTSKDYKFTGWTISNMDTTTHYIGKDTTNETLVKGVTETIFKNLRSSNGTVSFTATWQAPSFVLPTVTKPENTCKWISDEYSWDSLGTYTPNDIGGATSREFTASCTPIVYDGNIYTITFNKQSGTGGTTTIYEKYNFGWYSNSTATTSINKITIPTRVGYTFNGYYVSQNGLGLKVVDESGNIIAASTSFKANTTLYAYWTLNSYSISYDLDGGEYGSSHPETATYNSTFTINNPSKSIKVTLDTASSGATISYSGSSFTTTSLTKNYTFNGWTITNMDSTTHTIGSKTLTDTSASGVLDTSFKNLRSTSGTVAFSATYSVPEFVLPRISKTGYTCYWVSGTYTYQGLETYSPATVGGITQRSFTARCDEKVFTITLDKQGGSGGTNVIYLKYNTGWYSDSEATTSISSIVKPTKSGYTYNGYYDSSTEIIDASGTILDGNKTRFTSDTTLTANWKANSYTISYDLDSGTHGSSHPTSANYNEEIIINKPTKGIKVTLDLNESGATIDYTGSSFNSTNISTKSYTFNGWSISNMDTTTHIIGSQSLNNTTLTGVTETVFKNLRSSAGTVNFDAKWIAPSFVLPKLSKDEYICKWTSDEFTWDSGSTYSPNDVSGATQRAMKASCSPIIYDGNIYEITLNKQSGTGGTSTVYEKYNVGWYSNSNATTSITSITKPTREGYTFKGYYTEVKEGGTKVIDASGNFVEGTNILFKSASTIYAAWSNNSYTISYNLDKGTHGSSHPTSANYGSAITINNPTKSLVATLNVGDSGATINYSGSDFTTTTLSKSYTFNGWTISNMDTITHYIGSSSTTSTASTATGVTGTYFKNLRGTSAEVSFEAKWGSPSFVLPTLNKTGYTCKWVSDEYSWNSGDTYTPIAVGGATSRTFNASCTPNIYKITLNKQDGLGGTSTIYLKYNTGWYSNNEATTSITSITIPSKEGYSFNGYYTSTNGGGTKAIDKNGNFVASTNSFNSDTVLYASWTVITYSVNYDLDNGSYGTSHPTGANYNSTITIDNPNKSITVTLDLNGTGATIDYSGSSFTTSQSTKNYTFNGWTISGMDSTIHVIGGSQYTDTTLSGIFATTFKNLRSSEGEVTFTAKYSSPTFTLPKITKTEYTCNWTSDEYTYSSQGTYTPATTGGATERTMKASCSPIIYDGNIYTITLDKQSGTGGTTTIYEKYNHGWYSNSTATTSITSVTKPSRSGYTFKGYYTETNGNGTKVIDASGNILSGTNILFKSNTTIYAYWTANTYSVSYDTDGGSLSSSPTSVSFDSEFTVNNTVKLIYVTLKINDSAININYDKSDFTSRNSASKTYTFKGWNISGMDSTTHYLGSSTNTSTSSSATGIIGNYFKNLRSTRGTVSFVATWQAPSFVLPTITKPGNTCKWISDEYSWDSLGTYTPNDVGGATEREITASCSENTYTVTLNKNGGTGGTTTIYEKYGVGWYSDSNASTAITSVTVPAKTGYTFNGYYVDLNSSSNQVISSSGNIINNTSSLFEKDDFIYALWQANSYSINYDLDKGSYGTSHPTSSTYNSEFTVNNPSKSIKVTLDTASTGATISYTGSDFTTTELTKSYTFNGWSITNMDSTTHYVGSSTNTTTENSASNITGTYFKNLRSTSGTVTFTAGWTSPSFVLPKVSKTGYSCNWISDEYSYSSNDTYTPASTLGATSRTFTASCTPNIYTVTLNKQNGTGGTSTIYLKYNTGWYSNSTATTSISSVTVPTRVGYTFNGYYTQTSGNGVQVIDSTGKILSNKTTILSSSTSLYASWTAINYSISYSLDSGTYGSSHPTSASYDEIITINNPSKSIKVTLNNSIGATIDYTDSSFTTTTLSKSYTFSGWDISGMDATAHMIGSNSISTTTATGITETLFKNLRSTSGTVAFTAKWSSPSFVLPTVSKTGNTCKWISDEYTYNSKETYTPASTGGATTRTFTASCTPNVYTITLDSQSATTSSTSTMYVKYGVGWYSDSEATNEINSIVVPTKLGYTFNGYSTKLSNGTQIISSDGNIISNMNTTFTSNSTIYAIWTLNGYTISYDLDNGTHGSSHPTSANYGSAITINNPSKSIKVTLDLASTGATINYSGSDFTTTTLTKSYTFNGWDISGMDTITHYIGTSSNTSTSTSVSGIKGTYFKNLRSTSGEVLFEAKYSSPEFILPSLNKTDNTCVWRSDEYTYNLLSTYIPASTGGATSRTFTAECTPIDYNGRIFEINLNNQSASTSGTTTIYEKYNMGWFSDINATTSITSITSPTKVGYTFKGYYTKANGSGTKVIDSAGNIVSGTSTLFKANGELFAYWTINSYSISFDLDGGSHGSTYQTSANYNEEYTISNPHKSLEISLDLGSTNANVSYTNSDFTSLELTKQYTFTGWTITNMDSITHYVGLSTNTTTATSASNITGTFFKNLRGTSGTVSFTAKWNSPSVKLPTITKTGYTCKWVEGSNQYDSLQTYTPSSVNGITSITFNASCTPNVYTITLNKQGGSGGTNTIYLKYNTGWYSDSDATTSITYVNVPTKTGYNFSGYYTQANASGVQITQSAGSILEGKTTAFTSNTTIYASYTPISYTINYDIDGGTHGSSHPTSANYNSEITVNNPSKSIRVTLDLNGTNASIDYSGSDFTTSTLSKNYTFNGWDITNMDSDTHYIGTSTNTTNSNSVSGIKGTYFKNLRSSSGTVSFTAKYSSPSFNLPKLVKEDYVCVWTSDEFTYSSGGVYSPVSVGGATTRTLTASCSAIIYDGNIYRITLDNQGGTGGSGSIYEKYNYGWYGGSDALIELAAVIRPTKLGYTFGGYFTETDGHGTKVIDSTGAPVSGTDTLFKADGTIYAKWTLNSYSINYNLVNGTHGSSHPTSLNYNAVGTIDNPTKSITVALNNNGISAEFDYSRSSFDGSDIVTEDYRFDGWTISGMDSITHYVGSSSNTTTSSTASGIKGTYFKNLRSDNEEVSFTATWTAPTYVLPYVSKRGYLCYWTPSTSSMNYDPGENYSCVSGVTYETMNLSCIPSIYHVTLNKNGGTGGTNSIYLKYDTGWYSDASATTSITSITPPTREGYIFAGYTSESDGNGTHVVSSSSVLINIYTLFTSSTTIYAQWIPINYSLDYSLDGGSYGSSHPTSANYDETIMVDNPSKSIRVTLDAGDSGATIDYSGSSFTTSTLTKSYTFTGWTITNMDSTTHTIGSKTLNDTSLSGVTDISFKNLRSSSGTVDFAAKWAVPTFTLPTISKADNTCVWVSGEYTYNSGGTYSPAAVGGATTRTLTVSCSPIIYDGNVYEITFDKQGLTGGTSTVYEKYNYGWYSDSNATNAITSITIPSKEGYSFKGYYTEENCNGIKIFDYNGSAISGTSTLYKANGTAYACVSTNHYGIGYNLRGGTYGTYHPSSISYGVADTISNPTKSITVKIDNSDSSITFTNSTFNNNMQQTKSYTFTGWNISGMDTITHYVGTSTNTTNSTTATGITGTYFKNLSASNDSIRFVATWSSPTFTLPTITKSGYTCVYESGGIQVPSAGTYTPDAINGETAITFTISCSTNIYEISLNKQGGTGGTSTVYEKYNTGWLLTDSQISLDETIVVPTKTGYTFGGYYTESDGNGTQIISKYGEFINAASTAYTSDGTAYAKWTAKSYSISYNTNGGTYGILHPTSANYDEEIIINNPSKTVKATIVEGDYSDAIRYSNSSFDSNVKTFIYQFNGWTITNMDSTAHTIGGKTLNDTSLSGVTDTSFKNLRSSAGTVGFEATYRSTTITLPTIALNGNTCYFTSGGNNYESLSSVTVSDVTSIDFVAVCEPNIYKITLNKNGGTGGTTQIYEKYGVGFYNDGVATQPITQIEIPSKPGYTFSGYTYTSGSKTKQLIDSSGNLTSNATNTMFTSDATINAKYTAIRYDIGYNLYSGSISTNVSSINYGSQATIANPTNSIDITLTIPSNLNASIDYTGSDYSTSSFTYNGFIFTGWTITDMDDIDHIIGGTTMSGTTLENITATTFKNLRNTTGEVTFTANYTASAKTFPTIKMNTASSKTKYACSWISDKYVVSSGGTFQPTPDNQQSSIEFTAQCTEIPATIPTYTITLNKQSGTGGTATIYEKYNTGWYSNSGATTSIDSITKPTREGYTFKGYYTQTGGNGALIINESGNIVAPANTFSNATTIYAYWQINNYIVNGDVYLKDKKYNETFTINNPTPYITISLIVDDTGAMYNSENTEFETGLTQVFNYTFTGWSITNMDTCTHYIGSTTTTNFAAFGVMDTSFKNLRCTSGNVHFEANYQLMSVTLPQIWKVAHICGWQDEDGTDYTTGGTYNIPAPINVNTNSMTLRSHCQPFSSES